jgi:site-specific DNA recombinase
MSERHSTTPARAVAYYRMSTDAQEGSIPAQRDWARKAAPREGVRVVAEFEDPGVAGGEIEHRPGLQAMLEFCEQRFRHGEPVEAVLAWDPDRLSRASSIKTSAVLARLEESGVTRLLTASDGWVDLEDATHRVLYLLKQDLAREGFCQGLARNVLRGQAARARDGMWLGGPVPYGYRLDAGRLAPDPATGPVVTWLFSAYASGAYSLRGLIARLRADGVAPPRPRGDEGGPARPGPGAWYISTLVDILAKQVYLGHTVWNLRHRGRYARLKGGRVQADDTAKAREQERRRKGRKRRATVANPAEDVLRFPDTHPPLTDPATFAAAARQREAGRLRTTPAAGGGDWLLTGLVRCGACEGRMHGASNRREKEQHLRYYCCATAKQHGDCWSKKMVPQDLLVEEAVKAIEEHFAEGPPLDALRAEVRRLASQGRAQAEAERARLRARLDELDADIGRGNANLARVPADLIPGVVAQVRAWQQEREEAALALGRLAAAAEARGVSAEKADKAFRKLSRLRETIKKATPAEARAALAGAVSKVTVNLRPAASARDMEVASIKVELSDAVLDLFGTPRRSERLPLVLTRTLAG